MVQLEYPRVIHPLVSFTFGVQCGMSTVEMEDYIFLTCIIPFLYLQSGEKGATTYQLPTDLWIIRLRIFVFVWSCSIEFEENVHVSRSFLQTFNRFLHCPPAEMVPSFSGVLRTTARALQVSNLFLRAFVSPLHHFTHSERVTRSTGCFSSLWGGEMVIDRKQYKCASFKHMPCFMN